uniref:ZP domain-containing protein n=1 Tax=Nippostrongylus brasiliensis TaxID=27835 RepID=A0A0N4XL94_NIPBR
LDEFGCSLFPNILPHVEYPSDLNGGILIHAFSLDVDQAAVFFECNVKLLLKLNGVCRRPICRPLDELRSQESRYRRHLAS